MVCLDTDILIGLLRNDAGAKEYLEEHSSEPRRTTAITAYELLKGASVSSKSSQNLALVGELLRSIPVLPLDQDSCELASSIYADVKGNEHAIGEFDVLIAAIAMHNEETLVTRDKHFNCVRNLALKSW